MKYKRAFTLIELMIVISIIGVLAAIALPNFRRAQFKAKAAACVENLKGIETSVEMYTGDFPPLSVPTVMDLENDAFIRTLTGKGYYKSIVPKCGMGGKYQIIPAGVGLGTFNITCTFHGTLSENLGGK